MALMDAGFDELNEKIKEAVEKEAPLIDELRKAVRSLEIRKLGSRPCRTIAPVATDGGENRLSFEPLNLEIIRVVDSNGTDLVQEVIPLSEPESIFESYVDQLPVLRNLLDALGGIEFGQLSYLVGRKVSGFDDAAESPPDIRGKLRAFRDILEWAVLLDLASRDWPTDVLLLRDGLLRTKVLRLTTFPRLDRAFRRAFDDQSRSTKHRVYLLGVAKTSSVLSKLSLAMTLEGVFEREYRCYAEVPRELEEKCYNYDRTWLDTAEDRSGNAPERYQSFGRLHLVKLAPARMAPVFPVDVPVWLMGQQPQMRQTVLEYLAHDAQETFPIIGYPNSLQRAHDFAVLTGLEMTVLGDMMLQSLLARAAPELKERLLRHVNLNRGLAKGGSRNAG
jgi:hypothetical protein